MKKILTFCLVLCVLMGTLSMDTGFGSEINENDLYAMGACLMDGESGRVLYEKNGYEIKAMASTTKVMTCIIALEYGDLNDVVKFSKYAASMPDVQLGAKEGEEFLLKDLLCALMLESHNDVAVAIAEHIGGSVKEFAKLMNKKAYDIGCYDTYFVTPNGLDATDDENGKKHSTTAVDLSRIMSYCIKNKNFIEITNTRSHSFTNMSGGRSYAVSNKNAFLDMMDGVISGKTGFTNDAGYCYVAALARDGRVYIISLLGCGWPYNKNYKWKDSKTLFNYGINEFFKSRVNVNDIEMPKILVKNGYINRKGKCLQIGLDENVYIDCYVKKDEYELLTKKDENIEYELEFKNCIDAPVNKDDVVGVLKYKIGDESIKEYNIYSANEVEEVNFNWIFKTVLGIFFMS